MPPKKPDHTNAPSPIPTGPRNGETALIIQAINSATAGLDKRMDDMNKSMGRHLAAMKDSHDEHSESIKQLYTMASHQTIHKVVKEHCAENRGEIAERIAKVEVKQEKQGEKMVKSDTKILKLKIAIGFLSSGILGAGIGKASEITKFIKGLLG